eukprot:m.158723 g.158723  ORF g.158723 m.158723 type:complete len:182 (+) comp15172_c0_seq6:52-597(+)
MAAFGRCTKSKKAVKRLSKSSVKTQAKDGRPPVSGVKFPKLDAASEARLSAFCAQMRKEFKAKLSAHGDTLQELSEQISAHDAAFQAKLSAHDAAFQARLSAQNAAFEVKLSAYGKKVKAFASEVDTFAKRVDAFGKMLQPVADEVRLVYNKLNRHRSKLSPINKETTSGAGVVKRRQSVA